MADCLVVPIHVEAVLFPQDRAVTEALEDFTRLPFCNGRWDVNPHIGYISEEIVSQPFQNQNLYLRAGVHLHWFLPPALTRGEENRDGSGMVFPRVPDRWLVSRSGGSDRTRKWLPKKWIVESDYVHPEGEGQGSIVFPLALKGPAAPYRRLGRALELDAWNPTDSAASRLRDLNGTGLTAVGYGLPTFAAFYPNCFSVFGFYDEEFKDSFPVGLAYSVTGWYNDPSDDFLKNYLLRFVNQRNPDLPAALEADLGWRLSVPSPGRIPRRMFCYGSVSRPLEDFKPGSQKVAVASSGLEALSAYLADQIAGGQDEEKARLEDQLEFLSIQSRVLNSRLDLDSEYLEGRQERTFLAVNGGSPWTIHENSLPGNASKPDQWKKKQPLPPEIARQLSELNRQQQLYDSTQQEIASMRRQLFSDWYKYMLCVYPLEQVHTRYPDIDAVRHFIERRALAPLLRKVEENDRLKREGIDPKVILLQQALSRIKNPEGQELYGLQQVPGPRYWQPREPVVLIADEGDPSFLESRITALECPVIDGPDISLAMTRQLLDGVVKAIETKAGSLSLPGIQQPWPVFLEWEVAFFSMQEAGNVFPVRDYGQDFITKNFDLKSASIELTRKVGKKTVGAAQVYSGYSILTPEAGIQLPEEIAKYLQILEDQNKLQELFGTAENEKIFEAWYQNKPKLAQGDAFQAWLYKNFDAICAWYQQHPKPVPTQTPDPIAAFLKAFDAMRGRVMLSQALSGFNDALLMHKQTLQLPIADPLGFPEYQAFAAKVAAAIQGENKSAPQPLNDFNPIRAGTMKILHLRLVDTFGRVKELPPEGVVIAGQMRDPADPPGYAWLAPRLVQPARLSFRWLAASPDFQAQNEMNPHPASQPICGWLLPNLLDGSLMVYDQAGNELGSLGMDARAAWQRAPGSKTNAAREIPNPHLRKVVEAITAAGKAAAFLAELEKALEGIAPDRLEGATGLALLIGHPVAVVRASLKLELLGRPAVHQGWAAFRQDLGRDSRDSDAFDRVRFPVRLGEQAQLNDSLVRYWREDPQGGIDPAKPDPALELSLSDPPQVLTMLLDPHGSVNATCGILPVKAIDIPPAQYAEVLQHLAMTFLAAPVLTNKDQANLPLPAVPGYGWTWLDDRNGEAAGKPTGPSSLNNAFGDAQEIREGWLKLTPNEKLAGDSGQGKEQTK